MQVLKSKITSCVQKKLHWNPTACIWKNGKIVQSITENSIVICNKIVDNKNYSHKICSSKMYFYILLTFLLITIALLIAVSIYSYLIKYQAKEKPLLPCHYTISKLKDIKNIL